MRMRANDSNSYQLNNFYVESKTCFLIVCGLFRHDMSYTC